MKKPSKQHIIHTLLKEYGHLYSKDLGISLQRGTPSALFQWLIASLLFSARIGSSIATEAAKSLKKRGWNTVQRMAKSTWKQRVQALHQA